MNQTETYREVVHGHNLMHLSSVDSQGMPHVRGIDFAAGDEDGTLFFITHRGSRKVEQLTGNANVAVSIDHDCPSWEELGRVKYIKGSGEAEVIKEPGEIQKVFGLLLKKFPFLDKLPGEPSDFVAVKVKLGKVYITDNTIGFGHTEEFSFQAN